MMPEPVEITEYESKWYFAGISPGEVGPRLIYRTSNDPFERPTGESDRRVLRAIPVGEHEEIGKEGLWDSVRDQVRFSICFFKGSVLDV